MSQEPQVGHRSEEADISITRQSAAAFVTMNRASKRNALTVDMRRRMSEAWPGLARDPIVYAVVLQSADSGQFCAGGDIAEMIGLAQRDPEAARAALAAELHLCWLAECFSKPTISLIDGPVMGGGNTVSLRGTHRVAGEHYCFAMPETAIGFIPNNGLAYNFARMPGELGMYLALTGATVGPADALRLGLVTHCIPSGRFGEICAALADADPVDPVLDDLHVDPGAAALDTPGDVIGRCFGAGTVEEVVERLHRETGVAGHWAAETIATLRARSPLALKLTHRLVREASALDLREVLELEYRLTSRLLELPDLHEGVRALLIDKDRRPRWQPGKIEDVGSTTVEAVFSAEDGAELALPTREQMQAMRV